MSVCIHIYVLLPINIYTQSKVSPDVFVCFCKFLGAYELLCVNPGAIQSVYPCIHVLSKCTQIKVSPCVCVCVSCIKPFEVKSQLLICKLQVRVKSARCLNACKAVLMVKLRTARVQILSLHFLFAMELIEHR